MSKSPKLSPEQREELFAVYNSSKNEINLRIDLRHKIHTFIFIVAGTIISIGASDNTSVLVLLSYPILVYFLAIYWTQADNRVGQLSYYIREEIEPKLPMINWESYLKDSFPNLNRSKKLFGLRKVELSALGIIFCSQLIAFAIAYPKLTYTSIEYIFLSLDGLFLIGTIGVIIQSRRA